MSAPLQQRLISALKSANSDSIFDDVLSRLEEPADTHLEEIRSKTALVCILDEEVLRWLLQDQFGSITLRELLDKFPLDYQSAPPGFWTLRPSIRETLLERLRKNESEFRKWNTRLYHAFKQRGDRFSIVQAAYHAAASDQLEQGQEDFEIWFAAADKAGDFAYCQALLDALRVQEASRGNELTRSFQKNARYLQTRLLFLDALQKSSTYLERKRSQKAVLEVLGRQGTDAWIFHVHARGGMGKTMLLRWLIAQHAVPNRIPCARVDLDEYRDAKLIDLATHPLRLFSAMVSQWAKQISGTALSEAARILTENANITQWDPDVLSRFEAQMRNVGVEGPLLVVLDTLEEATLSQSAWLKKIIEELRGLHRQIPQLTLVLSGRYDLTKREVFVPGEFAVFEIWGFPKDEAVDYLVKRKINPTMQDAILARTADREVGPDGKIRYNPFKLALIGDLIDERDIVKPEDIASLPDADVAYLVERVILRIPSQPLRWMIRYGAIARTFDQAFMTEVLLPPLKDALEGKDRDLEKAQVKESVRAYLDKKAAWKPEPALASTLNASALWDQLKAYARDRGWVSENTDLKSLQLHPEVIDPLRDLLGGEPVFQDLHRRSSKHFAAGATDPNDDRFLKNASDAVYHLAQVNEPEARQLWERLLKNAGPKEYALVTEGFRTEYLLPDEKRTPKFPEWYCAAHLKGARLMMIEAGAYFDTTHSNFSICLSHIWAVTEVNPDALPDFWKAYSSVLSRFEGNKEPALGILDQDFPKLCKTPEDLLWLRLFTASECARRSWSTDAEKQWVLAKAVISRHPDLPVKLWQISERLARLYRAKDQYSDAMKAYDEWAEGDPSAVAPLVESGEYALDCGSTETAVRRRAEILEKKPPGWEVAGPRILVQLDPLNFGLGPAAKDRVSSAGPGINAWMSARCWRQSMDYGAAMEWYSVAAAARWTDSELATIRIEDLELRAFEMQDLTLARQFLEKTTFGQPTQDLAARIAVVQAYLHLADQQRGGAVAALERFLVEDTPPHVVFRLRLYGLLMGLTEFRSDQDLKDLVELVDEVDPPERLIGILEFVPIFTGDQVSKPNIPSRIFRRWRSRPNRQPPPAMLIRLADLARIVGGNLDSELFLNAAWHALPQHGTPEYWYVGVELLETAERCGVKVSLTFSELLQNPVPVLAETPLAARIRIGAYLENRVEETQFFADQNLWKKQVPSARRTLLLGSKTTVAERPEAEANMVRLSLIGSFELEDFEVAFKYLEDNWDAARDYLSAILWTHDIIPSRVPPGGWLQLETSLKLAHVPWELAHGIDFVRTVERTALEPPGDAVTPRVLVLKPLEDEDVGSFAISDAADSGFAVESLYYEAVGFDRVSTLKGPDLESIRSQVSAVRPAVIHIIAQLRETKSGVYLDFEGADRRLRYSSPQSFQIESFRSDSLNSETLSRLLYSLRPLLILDITQPHNRADSTRMLLLRNRFAAELFQTGFFRAVLATGLEPSGTRQSLERLIVDHAKGNSTLGDLLLAIHNQARAALVNAETTALFTDDPFGRIFGTDIVYGSRDYGLREDNLAE